MKRVIGVLAAATTLFAGSVYAQDSELGATSEDRVTINADIAPAVRIAGLPDLVDFGVIPIGADFTAPIIEFCVYSNVATNFYDLTVAGTNTATPTTAFALELAGNQIAYTVSVSDADTAAPGVPVDNGGVLQDQLGQGTDSACGTNNAGLTISITQAEIDGATAGTDYADTIVLTVVPS